jgi:hypothetical protein
LRLQFHKRLQPPPAYHSALTDYPELSHSQMYQLHKQQQGHKLLS